MLCVVAIVALASIVTAHPQKVVVDASADEQLIKPTGGIHCPLFPPDCLRGGCAGMSPEGCPVCLCKGKRSVNDSQCKPFPKDCPKGVCAWLSPEGCPICLCEGLIGKLPPL
ncbi:hypothetical protein ScPMuIL_003266 [Solemya velum]